MTRVPSSAPERTLLLVVADGVRHDVLRDELARGNIPAIAALCERGHLGEVTTCFPSVTGPGYVPFLTGRFPAEVGVPGLRWFDRARQTGMWPGYSRSYAGIDIWFLDYDLQRDTPTLFEAAQPSLAAMSMLGRGSRVNFGRSVAFMLRVSPSHFRGDLDGWRVAEKLATKQFLRAFAEHRPRFATLAITSADKRAHKEGGTSEGVRNAIRDIDHAIAEAQAIAARDGWAEQLDVWIVGDHGHAPVSRHEDLHGWLEQRGLRVRAHPQIMKRECDVTLMVGGNAMAHLYLNPSQRVRSYWPALEREWQPVHDDLLQRESVDLLAVAVDAQTVRVSSATLGVADVQKSGTHDSARWSYRPVSGDPLQLGGEMRGLDTDAAYRATAATPYPDSIVQLASLVPATRSGDIVVSAARDWDLRSRFEPVAHISTHGALLREQMTVPLIVSRKISGTPQRTADVFPSALELLGLPVPEGLDGRSFL
ncbi:MAG: alkaline phosphatase family protein [Gemmatimonas sp.]